MAGGRPRKRGGAAAAAASSSQAQSLPESQPPQDEDVQMDDAPVSEGGEAVGDSEQSGDPEVEEERRVTTIPGGTDKAASFEFLNEGHTLGNALRWVIMKNPDVEFCAYTIPHPSEAKMHVRIQTYEGDAGDALQKGLRDLASVCDVVAEEFTTKVEAFKAIHGDA